nr:MAG TPA: hypothetical protein [Caudoviricetes sp.]
MKTKSKSLIKKYKLGKSISKGIVKSKLSFTPKSSKGAIRRFKSNS